MTVLLIDPFSSGSHYHQLLEDTEVPYHVIRTTRAISSGLSSEEQIPHLVLDRYTDDQLAEVLHLCRTLGITTVITGAESGVPLAEALKVELGLASKNFNDHGRRFWDKRLLYSVIARSDLRAPQEFGVFSTDNSPTVLQSSLAESLNFPVVIKPDVGAGSVGVRIVGTETQLIDAVKDILNTPGFFGGKSPRAIAQECIAGREYVVDTVSRAGVHYPVAICTYDKHPSSTGSMVYDRLRWIEQQSPEAKLLTDYAIAVLDALEHQEGSVHMEIIIDDSGPCIIDLGARPHGAGHPLKTYHLTGASQLHNEVAFASKTPKIPPHEYQLNAHAAIEFLSVAQPATIRTEATPTDLLDKDYVLSGEIQAQPGQTYPETQSLLDSEELGLIFISGKDDEEIIRNAQDLRATFATMIDNPTG